MNSEKASPVQLQLLTELIEGICKYPGELRIEIDDQHQSWPKFTILPHEADYPVISGRNGRQIKALQFIGAKLGYQVQLAQAYVGEREAVQPFQPDPNFDVASVIEFVRRFCRALFPRVERMEITSRTEEDGKIKLVLQIPPYDAGAMQTIAALEDAIFPYAKRKGGTVKLSPFKQ